MSHEPTKEELFAVINLNFDASLTTKLTAANTIRDAKWQEQLDAQTKRIAELEDERDDQCRCAAEWKYMADRRMDAAEKLIARAEAAEAKVARLREALKTLTGNNCTYYGHNIVIPARSHGNAIITMRLARAALKESKP